MLLVGQLRACPTGYMSYSVAPGDTLGNIATACGTTVSNLAGVNALPDPNYIYPCESLCIPSGCYLGSGYSYCSTYVTASTCAYSYTVASGDTLSAIASRCGTTYQTIASLNGIAYPYTIYPCEVLCMPTNCYYNTGATSCATGVGSYTASCAYYYDVAPGDTLSSIASRCSTATSYQTIASLSGISNSNLIYPCQRLCLPAGCSNLGTGYSASCATASQCAYTYTVQPGDTLNNIAANCGTTATTIASLSNIANANLIYPCQVLCLPSSCSIGTGYTTCSATGYTGNTGTGTASCAYSYYVAPGDTLNAIASRCGTTAATIGSLSGITNLNLIYPCQRICLPSTCYTLGSGYTGCSSYAYSSSTGCTYSYTVASGDTLSSIATKCGISSYLNIASLNNIASPYTIYPCETLCLPSYCNGYTGTSNCATGVSLTPTCTYGTYYVAPGDTLSTIATRCGTTYQTLASLSNIANPDIIYPCDKVCLPYGCNLGTGYSSCVGTSLPGCAYTYSVAPGDSLSSIAAKCGTTYQTIANLSGILDPNMINVCQVICLPFSCYISPGYRSC